jgi:FkbM family methyltransferase
MTSRLARAVVIASGSFASSRLATRTPGRQVAGVLTNRVAPRLAELAFKPGVQSVNGIRMLIPAGSGVGAGGEYHMALGTYEMGEVAYIVGRLEPGGGMVDVGAHIGYFAIAAAAKVGAGGRVIAVEPTASSAATLRSNVELNGFGDRVTVVEAAASDRTGVASLHVSGTSNMFNTLETDTLDDDDVEIREIATTTVDDLLEQAGWPAVQLLKMDVEGHERSVLRGAERTLDRYPDLEILFEMSGTSEERFRVSLETADLLAASGFGFSLVDGSGTTTRADPDALQARMRMPRWQDSLFNVVAHRR